MLQDDDMIVVSKFIFTKFILEFGNHIDDQNVKLSYNKFFVNWFLYPLPNPSLKVETKPSLGVWLTILATS